jgi:hypothetical protein
MASEAMPACELLTSPAVLSSCVFKAKRNSEETVRYEFGLSSRAAVFCCYHRSCSGRNEQHNGECRTGLRVSLKCKD